MKVLSSVIFYLFALRSSDAFAIVPLASTSTSSLKSSLPEHATTRLSMAAPSSSSQEAVYGELVSKLERAGSLLKEAVTSRVQQIDIPEIAIPDLIVNSKNTIDLLPGGLASIIEEGKIAAREIREAIFEIEQVETQMADAVTSNGKNDKPEVLLNEILREEQIAVEDGKKAIAEIEQTEGEIQQAVEKATEPSVKEALTRMLNDEKIAVAEVKEAISEIEQVETQVEEAIKTSTQEQTSHSVVASDTLVKTAADAVSTTTTQSLPPTLLSDAKAQISSSRFASVLESTLSTEYPSLSTLATSGDVLGDSVIPSSVVDTVMETSQVLADVVTAAMP